MFSPVKAQILWSMTENCQRTPKGVVKKIIAMGGKAIAVAADVSKKAEVTAMAAETVKKFGAIDILVNNAGIESHPVLTMELSEESGTGSSTST